MIFYLIPIQFVAFSDKLNEPSTYLRSLLLILVSSVFLLFQSKIDLNILKYTIPLIILVAIYSVDAIVNQQNLATFLHGGYGRGFGVLTFLGLLMIFLITAQNFQTSHSTLINALTILIFLVIIYGIVQFLNLDPISWEGPTSQGLVLTLGNINYSGALIGLMFPISIFLVIKSKAKKIFLFPIPIVLLWMSFLNGSLQSPVILSISSLAFFSIVSTESSRKVAIMFRRMFKASVFLVPLAAIFFLVVNIEWFTKFREQIFQLGTVRPRLGYWQLGGKIWLDHPIFGVGIDGMQRFTPEYRTIRQVQEEGIFVYPDKSHNVLIDHFANGGVFAGLTWISFIILISVLLIKATHLNLQINEQRKLALFGSIWVGYVVQTLISPDHLILAVLGFVSAGAIVSQYHLGSKNNYRAVVMNKLQSNTFRIVVAICLLASILTYAKALEQDLATRKALNSKSLSVNLQNQVLTTWPVNQTIEEVGMYLTKTSPRDCEQVMKFSRKLLEINSRSSHAWYMRAVCDEQRQDIPSGYISIKKALKVDPLNPVYLLSKAIFEIYLKEYGKATETLSIVRRIAPNLQNLEQIQLFLNTSIQQAK